MLLTPRLHLGGVERAVNGALRGLAERADGVFPDLRHGARRGVPKRLHGLVAARAGYEEAAGDDGGFHLEWAGRTGALRGAAHPPGVKRLRALLGRLAGDFQPAGGSGVEIGLEVVGEEARAL